MSGYHLRSNRNLNQALYIYKFSYSPTTTIESGEETPTFSCHWLTTKRIFRWTALL